MVSELRKKYNDNFTQDQYEKLVLDINTSLAYPADFKISETPLFLSPELTKELITAAHEIFDQVHTQEYKKRWNNAIPLGKSVPNEDEHTTFLQIDFAISQDSNGRLFPQLIELQGFPSLYCFQAYFDEKFRKHFTIPKSYTTFFGGLNFDTYTKMLHDVIVGNCSPENVVLLEIEPEKQKTRIDFACTRSMLGVNAVNLAEVIKKGKKLFYLSDGREIPIERIYNRVIFDELEKKNFQYQFQFTDELDVTWVGHPNWYFKISKYSLPFIHSKYAPQTHFLNEIQKYPDGLQDYVLKPLFSFAGSGVEVDVTKERLDSIADKENYILQKKIEYAPLVLTPDGFSKAEIRMMFIWKDNPMLVNNLVRMSKGKMMGVDYNKGKTWVGSSLAYHP